MFDKILAFVMDNIGNILVLCFVLSVVSCTIKDIKEVF